MSCNSLELLEERLYANGNVIDILIKEIDNRDREGVNIFMPALVKRFSSLRYILSAAIDKLHESIESLCELLCDFPSANTPVSDFEAANIKKLFQECRLCASDVIDTLGPVYKMALAGSEVIDRNIIHKLNLEVPKSVYEFPQWIADCAVLGDIACSVLYGQSSNCVSDALSEDLQVNPINIRMLRCLDNEDPVAKKTEYAVALKDLEFAKIEISHGEFDLPIGWLQGDGYLIGYVSTKLPMLKLVPIDNYAQMLRDHLEEDEARDIVFDVGMDMFDHRFIVADASKAITVPSEYLARVNIPDEDNVACDINSGWGHFEVWEPKTYMNALSKMDLSYLFE